MKKAKQFIISSTFALFLSSSAITSAASYPTKLHEQTIQTIGTASGVADASPYVFSPKEDRHQKKMHYKQKLLAKKEKRVYK